MNQKIDKMNQNLSSLHSDMSEVKILLEAQEKHAKLEFQLSCADLESFTYYFDGPNEVEECDSSDMVRRFLKFDALGRAYIFHAAFSIYKGSNNEKGQKEFRDKLKEQLETIMGHEPRFVGDDGWYTIYES